MQIYSGEEGIEYTNVAVGDVYLAGGQSNMEFAMYSDEKFEEESAACTNHRIRFFDYPKVAYEEQMTELPHKSEGFWRICDKENLKYFSAVGYYFAKNIQEALDVPVGIIGCNWGGSTACCWMDGKYCENTEGSIWWEEYQEILKALDYDEYEKAVKQDFSVMHNDWIDTPFAEFMCHRASLEGLKAALSVDIPVLTGPKSANRPSGLYETMLKKLVPYAIKGVIWYQGESDDIKADIYGTVFKGLIQNWRDLWREELPFLFVQVAPYEGYGRMSGKEYPKIRSQQQWVADHVKNTAMAVITDVGDRYDIHPKNKRPVGERLSYLALKYIYGKDIFCESPALVSGDRNGKELEIVFSNAGEGLFVEGVSIQSLEIWQGSKKMEDYTFVIERNVVKVQSKFLEDTEPLTVKIACQPYFEINLYNSSRFPARPSQIDIL